MATKSTYYHFTSSWLFLVVRQSFPLTVSFFMSNPGSTNSVASSTCVCGGNSGDACVSPESLLLSPGCPFFLQYLGPIQAQLPPGVTVSSKALKALRSDFTLPQRFFQLVLVAPLLASCRAPSMV